VDLRLLNLKGLVNVASYINEDSTDLPNG